MTLTGRVETLETQVANLNQSILSRPDITSFQSYQIGHEQELASISAGITVLKEGLRNLNGLYAALFQTVTTNNSTFSTHTGDTSLHSASNSYRVITGNYTLAITDSVISFNNTGQSITATLPSAVTASGNFYWFNKIDTGSFSGIITGAAVINGEASKILTGQYSSTTVYSNGSVWYTF